MRCRSSQKKYIELVQTSLTYCDPMNPNLTALAIFGHLLSRGSEKAGTLGAETNRVIKV